MYSYQFELLLHLQYKREPSAESCLCANKHGKHIIQYVEYTLCMGHGGASKLQGVWILDCGQWSGYAIGYSLDDRSRAGGDGERLLSDLRCLACLFCLSPEYSIHRSDNGVNPEPIPNSNFNPHLRVRDPRARQGRSRIDPPAAATASPTDQLAPHHGACAPRLS